MPQDDAGHVVSAVDLLDRVPALGGRAAELHSAGGRHRGLGEANRELDATTKVSPHDACDGIDPVLPLVKALLRFLIGVPRRQPD